MHAAQVFRHMLGGRFSIKQVIAFGSRARGGHTSESDLDLAIVLDGPPGDRFAVVREMAGVAFDAMLETQILVDAVPIWLAEFDGLAPFSNPALIETIKTEGIVL
jgi:predicted nucleotidyltransferase